MFAVVRTGGKQYRVAAGDKIAVEKLAGEAGDTVVLDDVLLAGDGADIKDSKGLTVSAEIVAQARGEKVIVFKQAPPAQLSSPQRPSPVADDPQDRRDRYRRAQEGCRQGCRARRRDGRGRTRQEGAGQEGRPQGC